MVLTHLLTDEERESQELAVVPDLGLVMLASPDGQTFPLADGGVATHLGGVDLRLSGREGWLPDAPALELTVRTAGSCSTAASADQRTKRIVKG